MHACILRLKPGPSASFKEKGAGLEKENGGRRALWAGSSRQGGAGASPKIFPEPLLMDGYPGYHGYLPIGGPFFEDIHFSGRRIKLVIKMANPNLCRLSFNLLILGSIPNINRLINNRQR
jgi:hypothetical protein